MTSSLNLYDGLTPSFFDLPAKFSDFRHDQLSAVEWTVYEALKKVTAVCLPTGAGKSLYAVAVAKALGCKAVYLTSTRALEAQVIRDFASCGMVDVRGRQNYNCVQVWPGAKYQRSCDFGHKNDCSAERSDSCGYTAAVTAAKTADLIVTNYAYWMNARKYNKSALEIDGGGRPVELLICDEFGDVPELLSSFVALQIAHDDEELPIAQPSRAAKTLPSGLMTESNADCWKRWAVERLSEALKQIATIKESYANLADAQRDDRYVYLQELVQICQKIPTLGSNWVWEVDNNGVKFQPIWPGAMSGALWSGVPRVIAMSATLRPYTLGLCGLARDDYDFREWPAVFLPQLGPVYHLPTVKLTWKSADADYATMWARVDECLDQRADRRTIVHTGSYKRAKMLAECSRHRSRMILNESGRDAADCAEQFKRGPDNGVLVGPSYTTGYDFPGRDCEFQIIVKTPYPDETSRVMKERCKNGDYRMHVTVQKLVQIVGRPRRYATDRGETVILDNGIKWAAGSQQNPWHGHAPGHFRMQTVSRLPPAPPRVK